MSAHPSEPELERYSVGDLSPEATGDVERHLPGCAECRAFLVSLEALRKTRQAEWPADRFVSQVLGRAAAQARRRRWTQGLLTTGTVLTALAIWAILPASMPVPRPPEPEAIRYKGLGITIHRLRDGVVTVLAADDRLRAGDALRVVLTLPQASQAAAWFVDANGRVDAVLEHQSTALGPGQQAFPGSMIVDAPCVDATLVVALGESTAALDAARLRVMAHADASAELPANVQIRKLRCE